jgi:ADP-ribose pyrophosphatase YjhB (NUDIX family)
MPLAFPSVRSFWAQLLPEQKSWLSLILQRAQQAPPQDWLPFFGDGVFLGHLSPERAEQLVLGLSGCQIAKGCLLWQTPTQTSLQRGQQLQAFLRHEAAHGRVTGWRHESFCFWPEPSDPFNFDIPPWFCVERAGFRHLGMKSHAVHINGFCPNGDMWCGRRAVNKATDPGLLDNLAAGGMPSGESKETTALRELQEEAGITRTGPSHLNWAGHVRSQRTEPQGWHDEQLWVANLDMADDERPCNQDGEVQLFLRLTPTEVLQRMQAGEFTMDSCLALAVGLGLTSHRSTA